MSSCRLFLGGKVSIPVSDLDRAICFYTEGLGLALRLRVGDCWAEVASPGLVIGLRAGGPTRRERVTAGAPELSLEVEDLGAAVLALRARGLTFRPWLSRDGVARSVRVLDPDGNAIHLREAAYAV